MICNVCNDGGLSWECHCRYKSEEEQSMCSDCDGTGHVECPRLEEDWHK